MSEASAGVRLGHARLDWGCCALLLWFFLSLGITVSALVSERLCVYVCVLKVLQGVK